MSDYALAGHCTCNETKAPPSQVLLQVDGKARQGAGGPGDVPGLAALPMV